MKERLKYNGESYIFDIVYTFSENGRYYAVTRKGYTYRMRFDLLSGVRAQRCTKNPGSTQEIISAKHVSHPSEYPLSGEHYVINNGELYPSGLPKCPIFGAGRKAASLVFRLILLLLASGLAYFLFCKGSGMSFAESLFPTLSFKRLRQVVFVVELVGSLAVFFIKGDNTDIFDIVNCACLPIALIWSLGAVRTSLIIAVAASIVLAVCVCLYVFPFVSDRIREKRAEYKREINRDIASQSVYVLSLCLATCIFGTSLLGIVGYSDKVEYSRPDSPESSYIELLGRLKKWDSFDAEEKLDTISDVHRYEAKRLGIEGADILVGYPSNEREYGAYNPITNEIILNRTLLEEGDLLELIDTVIHETRHLYQKRLADAYTDIEDSLDDKYKSLPVFVEAKAFRDNSQSYTDAIFDELDYYYQPLELDAREYAQGRVECTYERVLDNTYYFE